MKPIFLVLCLVGLAFHETAAQSRTYGAGVVEFLVNEEGTHEQRFQNNAAEYIRLLEVHPAQDIVVFPEATLNSEHTAITVPSPNERIIPCSNSTYNVNLQNISCAVQRARKYVVVNLVMRRNCEDEAAETGDGRPCRADGWNLYSTNVVFDRNGMVISVYRKFNLHRNEALNSTLVPDVSTFLTDFDVTFGHLSGLDILFESPAAELIALNVSNFVYTVRMRSEIPFITALQIQEGWAISNNVNLLAAGANQPSQGSSGTGIYSGGSGALQSLVTGLATSTSLNHNVPVIPGQLEDSLGDREFGTMLQNLQLINDEVSITNFHFINPTNTTLQAFELCEDSVVTRLCCNFQIQVISRGPPPNPPLVEYSYAAVAFNDHRSFVDDDESFVRICAVLACTTNNDINSCGTARPTETAVVNNFNFTTINIRISNGGAVETDLSMPSTLDMNLLPLTRSFYSYANTNDVNQGTASMNLTGGNRNDLLTFGIYIRDFTYSSAVKPTVSLMALIVTLIFYFK